MANNLYIAYGSNLNLRQMSRRCPTAKPIGTGMLKDYQLTFRSVATIEKVLGAETPVGIWEITSKDESSLDRYEGYPHLYRKEIVTVTTKNGELEAMVYIMNKGEAMLPNQSYYNTIEEGYMDVGLDLTYLHEALRDTIKRLEEK